jgi:probable HAF family extracellular repeat protein
MTPFMTRERRGVPVRSGWRLAWAVLPALSVMGIGAGQAAPLYTALDLGLATVNASTGAGVINDAGQVAWATVVTGVSSAFLYSGGTTTNLGSLGGTSVLVRLISASGVVTGSSSTAGNATSQVYIYSGGTMTAITHGVGANATAINASGQVTGSFTQTLGASQRAFIYSGGVTTVIGTGLSIGSAINASGQVTGFDGSTAFVYSGGVRTDLGAFGGLNSTGVAINDAGQVMGNFAPTTNFVNHAFVYSGGVMTDLGTLGGTASTGQAMNAYGAVTGSSTTAGGASHAFVAVGGGMTDLGTLGGATSFGYAINARGEVLGTALTSAGVNDPFLYTGGVLYDVNALLAPTDPLYGLVQFTGTNVRTTGVGSEMLNDSGQFLANGKVGGVSHLFMLTPVEVAAVDAPEPSSMVVLAVGLAGVLAGRRRAPKNNG